MRERRAAWDDRDDDLIDILREGSRQANAVAEETLAMAKEAAGLGFEAIPLTEVQEGLQEPIPLYAPSWSRT